MKDLFRTESLFGHGTSFGHKFKNTDLTYGPILRGQVKPPDPSVQVVLQIVLSKLNFVPVK